MPRTKRIVRKNPRTGKWVVIECRKGRKPPCRIVRVTSRKPR